MKFLFIMDAMELVSVDADTTFAIMLAAQERGHEAWYCTVPDVWVRGGKAFARATPTRLQRVQGDHCELGESRELPLSDFEAVWMRKDPPFDAAYVYATYPLDLAGTLVVNNPDSLRNANEKMYATHFPEVMPRTLVSRDARRIAGFVNELGGIAVAKPLYGMGGLGVVILRANDGNMGAMLELTTEMGKRWVMVQEYLDAATLGDARILIMDGEVLGGVLRMPQGGDHRANIHVGATVEKYELDDAAREICDRIMPDMKRRGLYFVGIDVIGGKLTEINVTSPTGIQELQRLSGGDPSGRVIDWLEAHPRGRGL